MYQYRIYVGCNVPSGDAYPPDVVESIGLSMCPFDGCTVQYVTGVWKEAKERTVVFEYVGPEDAAKVREWAERLKDFFFQEAVMVTRSAVACFFV